MNKLENIIPFINQQLVLESSTLEPLRKKVLYKVLLNLIPYGLFLLSIAFPLNYWLLNVLITNYQYDQDPELILCAVVVTFVIVAVVSYFFYKKQQKVFRKYLLNGEYISAYKKNVVGKLIPIIDKRMNYHPHEGMKEAVFQKSFPLFNTASAYYSEDSVSGQLGTSTFTFAEILAEQIISSGSSSQSTDLFRGLLFVANLNKQTDWNTIVYPDKFKYVARFIFGKNSNERARKMNYYERVKLEDPEFEKLFQVYGTDQIESRYILSPALMARMVDLQKKTKLKTQFSFQESKVYIAVHYTFLKSMFSPPLLTSTTNNKSILSYLEKITLMIELIEELNFNSQINTNRNNYG